VIEARQAWALAGALVALGTGEAHGAGPMYRRYTDAQGVVHVTPTVRDAGAQAPAPTGPELRGSGEADGDAALPESAVDPKIAGRARDAAAEVSEALGDERSRRYEPWIRGAAKLYQLPESLVRAVIHTESNYNPNVVSGAGAMGLTQLMPSTARFLGVTRPFDPRQNIYGGAKFLRLLANRFGGDMVLVLAGYFSGAGAVQKYGGVPPHSGVRGYVKAVLRRFYAYERELQRREEDAAGPNRSIAVP
jgi:soluble lytic murein transglycosylase-like protein